MGWHKAPGLKRDLWLPDHIGFVVDLVPASQTLQRPGYLLWPDPVGVDHETGNKGPNTGAVMHNRYLKNGAPDQYGRPQYLSYHTCSDEDLIYLNVPLNEVTWQAACGSCKGNYGGHSNEMAVSVNYDKGKCRDTAEWNRAAIMEAALVPNDRAHITFHWTWNAGQPDRHHCPDEMLDDGYTDDFQDSVMDKYRFIAQKRAEAGLPTPPIPPKPEYAPPKLPTNFTKTRGMEWPIDNMKYENRTVYIVRRNFRVISKRGASRLDRPATKEQGALAAGPRLSQDGKIFGLGLWVNPDDNVTYLLEETGCWLRASQFTPQVRVNPRHLDD